MNASYAAASNSSIPSSSPCQGLRQASALTLEERVDIVKEVFAGIPGVKVMPFAGLLVDFAASVGAKAILRGLRAVSDFDYEFQMALMNRKLQHDVQTIFLMSDLRWMYISSTNIRNVASLGGDVRCLVPPTVIPRLRRAYGLPESWPASAPCTGPDPEDDDLFECSGDNRA